MNFDRGKVYVSKVESLPILGAPPRKIRVANEFAIEEAVGDLRIMEVRVLLLNSKLHS